ncbi:MAG: hypothetical protein ABJC60_02160 [Actinomycetota bacterium]
MAQALVVVCDMCGSPAVETVNIKVAARSYQKDVCQVHLDEMVQGARAPRRGRPRTKGAPVTTPATRRKTSGRSSAKTKAKAKSRRKTTRTRAAS